MSAELDPKSPPMRLWHALLAGGASEDEATKLMNDYAHELAEQQRAEKRETQPGDSHMICAYTNGWNAGRQGAADDIDSAVAEDS